MRVLYYLRVALISWEAATLAVSLLGWVYFRSDLATVAGAISSTSDVLKFVLLLPLVMVAWVATEVRQLLHEDKDTTRFLANWPDYWRLKAHVFVALAYSLMFASLSIVPWLLPNGITSAPGFLLFVAALLGQLAVVVSVYAARLRVKEVVALAGAA